MNFQGERWRVPTVFWLAKQKREIKQQFFQPIMLLLWKIDLSENCRHLISSLSLQVVFLGIAKQVGSRANPPIDVTQFIVQSHKRPMFCIFLLLALGTGQYSGFNFSCTRTAVLYVYCVCKVPQSRSVRYMLFHRWEHVLLCREHAWRAGAFFLRRPLKAARRNDKMTSWMETYDTANSIESSATQQQHRWDGGCTSFRDWGLNCCKWWVQKQRCEEEPKRIHHSL